jgi:hypothetical protein
MKPYHAWILMAMDYFLPPNKVDGIMAIMARAPERIGKAIAGATRSAVKN